MQKFFLWSFIKSSGGKFWRRQISGDRQIIWRSPDFLAVWGYIPAQIPNNLASSCKTEVSLSRDPCLHLDFWICLSVVERSADGPKVVVVLHMEFSRGATRGFASIRFFCCSYLGVNSFFLVMAGVGFCLQRFLLTSHFFVRDHDLLASYYFERFVAFSLFLFSHPPIPRRALRCMFWGRTYSFP